MNKKTLKEIINKSSSLKEVIIDYVGNKKISKEKKEEVTIEMLLEVFKNEFPEFILILAEENFIRGYHQCVNDFDIKLNEEDVHK